MEGPAALALHRRAIDLVERSRSGDGVAAVLPTVHRSHASSRIDTQALQISLAAAGTSAQSAI